MASGGLYSIVTRAPGTILTALFYNADHQAHVDGRTATLVAGYSQALGQMQLVTDPFPGSVESLPLSLGGEVERLRFVIAALKQVLNAGTALPWWYSPVSLPAFTTVGARVQKNAAFPIPGAGTTIIDFAANTAAFNTNSTWVGGTPTRFTAPVTGKYAVGCSVTWAFSNVTTTYQLTVGVNGVFGVLASPQNTNPGSLIPQHQTLAGILALTAGDYVEYAATTDGVTSLLVDAAQSPVGYLLFLGN